MQNQSRKNVILLNIPILNVKKRSQVYKNYINTIELTYLLDIIKNLFILCK